MERAERMLALGASLIFSVLMVPILWVMLVLTLFTAGHRFAMVWRQAGTSAQLSGVDTRASGVGRTEYPEATVRSFAFWLKSTKTPCRSSFHHLLVARSGARFSTSRAIVSAASRTSR